MASDQPHDQSIDQPSEAERLKHLDHVQAAIGRMAQQAFLIKGWSVTLAAALLALVLKEDQPRYALLALVPTLIFWSLDAYYLRRERLFRALYREAAAGRVPVFSMALEGVEGQVAGWWRTLVSSTIWPVHGVVVAVVGVVVLLSWLCRLLP